MRSLSAIALVLVACGAPALQAAQAPPEPPPEPPTVLEAIELLARALGEGYEVERTYTAAEDLPNVDLSRAIEAASAALGEPRDPTEEPEAAAQRMLETLRARVDADECLAARSSLITSMAVMARPAGAAYRDQLEWSREGGAYRACAGYHDFQGNLETYEAASSDAERAEVADQAYEAFVWVYENHGGEDGIPVLDCTDRDAWVAAMARTVEPVGDRACEDYRHERAELESGLAVTRYVEEAARIRRGEAPATDLDAWCPASSGCDPDSLRAAMDAAVAACAP